MKIFLINLKKNLVRLQKCDAQFGRLGLKYERFDAIYGKELPEETKRSAVSRFRWWCACGRFPNDGEIGCILSHYGVYEEMRKHGLDYACVVEDDIILKDEFERQLKRIEDYIDPNSKQVYFLFCHIKGIENTKEWVFKKTDHAYYAESYVITRSAAEAIVKANTPIRAPIDHWRRWVKRAGVSCFFAFPVVSYQDMSPEGYSSDITLGHQEIAGGRGIRHLVYRLSRCMGKIVDAIS